MKSMLRFSSAAKVAALLSLLMLFAATSSVARAQAPSGCWDSSSGPITKIVALDPGHGFNDSGAVYRFASGDELLEKNVVLDIAYRTRDILVNKVGYRVCLTRMDDSTNPSNTERAQYANSVNANVFVLIHLNGSSDPMVNYTKTFWGKKSKDLKFSEWMYSALYPAMDDVDWDGVRDNEVSGNGVGQFATGALLKSNMPGTLTESVFLTNSREAERLLDTTTSGRRQQIADVIASGIGGWLNR